MSVSPVPNPPLPQEASITVIKKVKQPDGTYALAAGWQFTQTSGTAPSPTITPPSGITGADGTVSFTWQISETTNITIIEEDRKGYGLSTISAKQANSQTSFFIPTGNAVNLNINPGDIISCEFFSDPLTLKPDSLPDAIAQQSYTTQLSIEGSSTTVTFSLVQNEATVAAANPGLPPGITLSDNGLLSGTPTVGGSFSFTVQAQGTEGYIVTRSYTLNVTGNVTGNAPTVKSPAKLNAPAGLLFTHTLEATGTPAPRFSLEPVAPSGMVIDPTTGQLTWTPSALGPYPVTVRVSNGIAPDAVVPLTITVTSVRMLYSKESDRSEPVHLLQGAEVKGNIYVFMEPAQDIDKVEFELQDNSGKQIETHTEDYPPFDFMGTAGDRQRANRFNTSNERDGSYTMKATVTLNNGTEQEVVVTFTIKNRK